MIKQNIISVIVTEIITNYSRILSLVGNAEINLTSETYDLNNLVKLITIKIKENVVTIKTLYNKVSKVGTW